MKTKMSKKELEQSLDAAHQLETWLSFALQSALDGEISWLVERSVKAGIVRPTSASGGVVVLRYKDESYASGFSYPRVYLLDAWVAQQRQRPAPSSFGAEDSAYRDSSYYQQWADEQELANRVLNVRNQAVEAENKIMMDRA